MFRNQDETIMKKITIALLLLLAYATLFAQQDTISEKKSKENAEGISLGNFAKISGHWIASYRDVHEKIDANGAALSKRTHTNSAILKRGYVTLKKDLNDVFSVRYTQDITVDKEGSDAGNVETKLKYLYLKVTPHINSKVFTGSWLEVGMVHKPWLDYEQKINTYRLQGNMAVLRNKLIISSDFGVTFGGNIGPKMDAKFLKEVNGAMKGKYFSYALGIHNGGGYSAKEQNTNKVFSGLFSFRPFANSIPQLQLSTSFNLGKGNTEYNPSYKQFVWFGAWTGRNLTFTAQYHKGEGDFKGNYVRKDNDGQSLKNKGYSFFGEYQFGTSPWAIWGRHDYFSLRREKEDEITRRYIAGITYRVNRNIRLVLDTEQTELQRGRDNVYELNLEIIF